jgi:hypothetical protein
MIKPNTEVVSYLNGKMVDIKTLQERKDALLNGSRTVVHMYYIAPLTDAEKEEEEIKYANAFKYFSEKQEMREEQEKFH